jgi:hypothetical protein
MKLPVRTNYVLFRLLGYYNLALAMLITCVAAKSYDAIILNSAVKTCCKRIIH